MPDILHKIGIKSSSPDNVYKALAAVDGLSRWWTSDTRGESNVGGTLQFRFGNGGFDMKVIELQPGKRVLWKVVDGPEEWLGTKINFDLKQNGDWAPGLERARGIHAALQHQMGGLPAEPEVAPRSRQRSTLAKRDQARQLGIAAL